ncbi:hypothetical protein BpHYR1_005221 [Brachionus plicatilis]|uniref:Uncharacterized protein n=1 Tax=Brachionus plicatilis TaxID=10195 RepID=A0A3M7RGA1_BRAPC|nr:hypothetical protein BpHYR1_005221 [Brachionus plicatilis]
MLLPMLISLIKDKGTSLLTILITCSNKPEFLECLKDSSYLQICEPFENYEIFYPKLATGYKNFVLKPFVCFTALNSSSSSLNRKQPKSELKDLFLARNTMPIKSEKCGRINLLSQKNSTCSMVLLN